MTGVDSFGALLRGFRTRLGDKRQALVWLAEQIGYAPATVYGWENGDLSKGLPARSVLLRIGQLYSLSAQEVNDLLAACLAQRKQRALAARYIALSDQEVSDWTRTYGPSFMSLDKWREQLEWAQTSYLDGELRSALRASRGLLDEIWRTSLEPATAGLWRPEEQEELARLWLLGWRIFFESASFLHDGAGFSEVIRSYRAQAETMAQATHDPVLRAIALHLEGDNFHIINKPRAGVDRHLETSHLLRSAGEPFALTALTQRLVLLDGIQALSRGQLKEQILKARRLEERATPDRESQHARGLLLEATARAMAHVESSETWRAIQYAEDQARKDFPIVIISALYTHALALVNDPGGVDVEQLRMITIRGLAIAEANGWERRAAQFRRLALAQGIAM